MSTVFATMQVSALDTGLGIGNGGAVINKTEGGFVNMTGGNGNVNLNFNGKKIKKSRSITPNKV